MAGQDDGRARGAGTTSDPDDLLEAQFYAALMCYSEGQRPEDIWLGFLENVLAWREADDAYGKR